MKIKIKSTILIIIVVITAIFAYPNTASAMDYKTGDIVTAGNNSIVYYIASDSHKYSFPNESIFLTWYKDFSGIKKISTRDMIRIPSAKTQMTIKPGVKLVKFPNSPKVYVVEPGALLRWLKSEKVAGWYYGKNWNEEIITLDLGQFKNYTFGQDLDIGDQFSKTRAVVSVYDANAELENREVLIFRRQSASLSNYTNTPTLKTLSENLKARLQPAFNYSINSYKLDAKYEEDVLILNPVPYDTEATVYVNGTPLKKGVAINLELKIGTNIFVIKVALSNNESIVYYLEVERESPDDNPFLKSITENLKDTLSPKFNSGVYEYEISAKYNETAIKLTAIAQDAKADIIINGKNPIDSYKQTENIMLDIGKNEIEIKVRAENGRTKTYKLTVYRRQYPETGSTNLLSLTENLDANMSPGFYPNMTRYFLRAKNNEDNVSIVAKAVNKDASVYINGIKTTSKKVYLEEGENEINIVVKIDGGFEKNYLLSVYRNSL